MKQWTRSSEDYLCQCRSEEDHGKDDRRDDERLLEAADSAIHVALAAERGPEPGPALLEEDGDDEENRGDELEDGQCRHTKTRLIRLSSPLYHATLGVSIGSERGTLWSV